MGKLSGEKRRVFLLALSGQNANHGGGERCPERDTWKQVPSLMTDFLKLEKKSSIDLVKFFNILKISAFLGIFRENG